MPALARAALVTITLLAVAGSRAMSQGPAAPDGGAPPNPWPQRAWLEAGVGSGTFPYGAISGIATGWYSVGPAVMGARLGGAFQFVGEQRGDGALLVGARTPGSRGFLLGAVGIANVIATPRPSSRETAYSVEAHGNSSIFGMGLVAFGVFGPRSARYNAIGLTLNAGWFGR